MPRERVFLYLCMCRYGYVKNERKQAKTDKNEHEIGKRSKAVAGEAKWSKIADNAHRSPQRFRKFNMGPWKKLWEIGRFSPCNFRIWQLWSLKHNLKKKANVVLHHSEYCNLYPWKNVWIYYRLVPTICINYKIGPCLHNTTNTKTLIQPDP